MQAKSYGLTAFFGIIQEAINDEIYFREHAIQKMVERNINDEEVIQAINNGEIIEEYPDDKYGPTCLIYGQTNINRPLHVLVPYTKPIWVITTYEPDESKWIDFKIRR